MCTPLSAGGGVEPDTKFSKRGEVNRTPNFRGGGGLLGKRGDLFQGVLQILHKNKLKSEMCNDKKSL